MRHVLALPFLLLAQTTFLPAQDDATFRAQSNFATLRFHVNQKGRAIVDLKPKDVVLIEDGAPRPFTVFENNATSSSPAPVEITLLLDTSGSVTSRGLLSPLVFRESLLDAPPNAKLAVYGFSRNLTRYSAPTRDFTNLTSALQSLQARAAGETIELSLPPHREPRPGGTWIYEAVRAASAEAAATSGDALRLLVVFSDGMATTTSLAQDAAELDRELGISVYPVILGHADLIRQIESEQRKQRPVSLSKRLTDQAPPPSGKVARLQAMLSDVDEFARLGALTGGNTFDMPAIDLKVLKEILADIVTEVRTEYTIGFPLDVAANPKRHKLEVRLVNAETGHVRGGTRTLVH
jgi:VWFA-related protein